MFHPDLRLLRCFAAIADTGSLTRAAQRLHLSQPTVSGQLRELEQALGFAARPGADRLTRQTKLLVIRFDIETDLVLQALGRR